MPWSRVYDAHGNTTKLADMTFVYDALNQHIGTTYADGTTVSIARDATGRIVARTVDPAGAPPTVLTKYLYTDAGDAAWGQFSGTTLTGLAAWLGLPAAYVAAYNIVTGEFRAYRAANKITMPTTTLTVWNAR